MTGSPEWQMTDGAAGADNDVISVPAGAAMSSSSLTAQNGIYSENNSTGSSTSIAATSYTEFWFAIRPQALADGVTYQFRIVTDGGASGIIFNDYPRATPPASNRIPRPPVYFFHGGSF